MCSYYKFPIEEQPFDDKGFLHTKDKTSFDEKSMIEFLSTRLAKFKIPAYFFVYEKFPGI